MRTLVSLALAAALAATAPAVAASDPARDVTENVGAVRGPLSDFWLKVRSEWSGYRQLDPGPPPGGGWVRQRSLVNPLPNRVWVSLVYGDLSSGRKGPLAHLFDEFLSEWKRAEGRNWPYAQIFGRTWAKMGRQGRTQNTIMIGTPWSLQPVGQLAESLGFKIAPGRIDIGGRKYRGDNLILIFIAPNPLNLSKYALVITGSNDEALMQAGHLPYAETDYVLFRGRRLLESGHFTKVEGAPWAPPQSYEAAGTHRGFAIRETAHYTFWYEQDRLPREDLDALVAEKEALYPSLTALAGVPGPLPRLTYYLYPSVDRKIDETARDDIVHVDLATSEIHTVFSGTERVVEPYLDLMVMLHRSIGPTRVPRLERALAIALAPRFQGHDIAPMAARVFQEARGRESAVLKALRDHDVMTPADGPPSAHDLLLAGFLQDLVRRRGHEKALEFVSRASPRGLDASFHDVYRSALGDALDDWAAVVRSSFDSSPSAEGSPFGAASDPRAAGDAAARGLELLRQRRDAEAALELQRALSQEPGHPVALAALARIHFRRGEFDAAERACAGALRACAGPARRHSDCGGAEAWSRLTLGRVEALRGRYVAARVELIHPAVKDGPAPVPTLADYWLLTMGQSRNRLTVVSHLKREARVSLRNLSWREAEERLKKALEIDPTDGEAHRLLSDVYHKQHEYWAWQIRYLNEIHPDYNVLSRIYMPGNPGPVAVRVESLHTIDSFNDLVLRGNLELLKAQSLYAVELQNLHSEGDRFLMERQDLDEALRIYRRALELNPDFFLSHFLVARCYFLMDRIDAAKSSFEEVLRRKPADALVAAWTHTYLGYIALREDDLAAAERSFERALTHADQGKVGSLAREGLGKVQTIRLLMPGPARQGPHRR